MTDQPESDFDQALFDEIFKAVSAAGAERRIGGEKLLNTIAAIAGEVIGQGSSNMQIAGDGLNFLSIRIAQATENVMANLGKIDSGAG